MKKTLTVILYLFNTGMFIAGIYMIGQSIASMLNANLRIELTKLPFDYSIAFGVIGLCTVITSIIGYAAILTRRIFLTIMYQIFIIILALVTFCYGAVLFHKIPDLPKTKQKIDNSSGFVCGIFGDLRCFVEDPKYFGKGWAWTLAIFVILELFYLIIIVIYIWRGLK